MDKKPNGFKRLKLSSRFLVGFAGLLLLSACQGKDSPFNFKAFKERASETPTPSEMNVEKSFFLSTDGKPKTFLCGWAPEVQVGELGESIFGHLDAASPHCNLEFVNEDEQWLVGRLVNPSFPNDRKKWKEYVKIHISSHFYYERAKDQHGRETNEWIENSTRSDWRARPMFKLDLSSIQLLESGIFWSSRLNSQLAHDTATEIEWDKTNGFLGFTLNMRLTGGLWGYNTDTAAQAKVRVNFLRYKHDANFKKTPYHQEDSRHMNILHVMGRRHDLEPELYAAKWDFSKPINLYINGADDKAIQNLLIAAIEKWNQTFIDEGVLPKGKKAFIPVVKNRVHGFDLRYPGITYVADRRISQQSAMGVGYAHADVQNGKILWGHVLIFGGMIERLIHSYSESDSGGNEASSVSAQGRGIDLKALRIPEKLKLPESLGDFNFTRSEAQRKFNEDGRNFLQQEIERLSSIEQVGSRATAKDKTVDAVTQRRQQIKALGDQITAMSNPKFGAQVVADLTRETTKLKSKTDEQFAIKNLIQTMGMKLGQKTNGSELPMSAEDKTEVNEIIRGSKSTDERVRRLRKFKPGALAIFPDQDLTGQSLKASMGGRAETLDKRSFQEVYDGVIMKLVLHEVGHMIGLGHQFKENILPEEGTVPSAIYKDLVEHATPEKHFTNLSSVMGYLCGRTWLSLDAKTLVPGPQDRLVVHYLYKKEYATFDKAADQFKFFAMPEHGRIPGLTNSKSGPLPVAYFPQCNDIEASYEADPFCNRWDRGSTALQLVKSYFEDLNDNLVSDLYSFVGGQRSDPDATEGWLWWHSFSTMSRVRLFYDEMRLRLSTDRELVPLWDRVRGSEEALREFSTACAAKDKSAVNHEALKELFFDHGRKSDEIRDLCNASSLALKEMKFLLNLPESDYTKIDTKERYIMSGYLMGDASLDDRQVIGKWYQMTNLPLKVASLFTLTTTYPFLAHGWPNPFYTTEGRSPLYRTLFPGEYTRMISDMVTSNMRFETFEKVDRSSLGNIILSAAWLLNRQMWSTDAGLLPTDFNRILSNQTEFQFSVAAILITANESQQDSKIKPNHYKRFTATMFDLMLNRDRAAREVYILPRGTVIVRVNDMFLVPITQMRFLDSKSAYVIAIKVDYDSEVGDKLVEQSVKAKLTEIHEQVNSSCIDNVDGTGLNTYFNASNDDFEGFYIPTGIADESSKEGTTQFFKSLDEEFAKFEAKVQPKMTGLFAGKNMKLVCDQAMRGVGQISSAAALLNGFWLPITPISLK